MLIGTHATSSSVLPLIAARCAAQLSGGLLVAWVTPLCAVAPLCA